MCTNCHRSNWMPVLPTEQGLPAEFPTGDDGLWFNRLTGQWRLGKDSPFYLSSESECITFWLDCLVFDIRFPAIRPLTNLKGPYNE
jgi:hypothetical protein